MDNGRKEDRVRKTKREKVGVAKRNKLFKNEPTMHRMNMGHSIQDFFGIYNFKFVFIMEAAFCETLAIKKDNPELFPSSQTS